MTELTPAEAENPLSGYGKTVSHVVVGLKTVRGTKQLRLDPSIYEAILKEKITIGDVIYIESNTGAVKVSDDTHTRDKITITDPVCSAWDDQMHMPRRTTSSRKHTFLSPRVTCIKERNSFRMLRWVTSTRQMHVHREGRIS